MPDVKCAEQIDSPIIREPGKYEGQPRWVPHFHDLALSGECDEDDGRVWCFFLNNADRAMFPELFHARAVEIRVDDKGFVTGELA